MLFKYFEITEGVVVFVRAHKVKKRDKSRQGSRTILAKILNYKDKECILKNTHHLKDVNNYVY